MRDGRYEVEFTAWAHGRHDPDKPWKVVFVTLPGAVSGEPIDGRRYMTSHAERAAAIMAAANSNARMAKRYTQAVEKANEILAEEVHHQANLLELSTRADDGRRPPS